MPRFLCFGPTDDAPVIERGPRVWLHGQLHLRIEEARAVPLDRICLSSFPETRPLGKGLSSCMGALHLTYHSDAYCTISVGDTKRARTSVIPRRRKTQDPVWNEDVLILVADYVSDVTIKVRDADRFGAPLRGQVVLNAIALARGEKVAGWFPLTDDQGVALPKKAAIKLSLVFQPIQSPRVNGVRGDLESPSQGAVPDVYFPQRLGNRVTLYHDAHQEPGSCTPITLASGSSYDSPSCWTDLYHAISNAKIFIYITGWSVQTDITLLRDQEQGAMAGGKYPTIGQMLIQKAEEGVRVLVMPWDDRTSLHYHTLRVQTPGVMGTHDQETKSYFKHTKVMCQLCQRVGGTEDNTVLKKAQTDMMFTHHQKTIVLDGPRERQVPGISDRQVIAFLGGLDITGGRYDTKRHSLFRTLQTEHKGDFYNGTMPGTSVERGGPRLPWHDIHARLEGPAALDVLHNFEQRWIKQAYTRFPDSLLKLGESGMVIPHGVQLGPAENSPQTPGLYTIDPKDPEAWEAQIFRSIDSDSVGDFPRANKEAMGLGLRSGKGKAIDFSIQKAMVHAIRRAQHFIYIENQYFMGSCQLWNNQYTDIDCTNLVPVELALKISSKILAGERFAVYVVVPLYPEGAPDSASMQEILLWQSSTMSMMYRLVAEALAVRKAADTHPRDYLNFFFLGNREVKLPGEPEPQHPPPSSTYYGKAQISRRFQIYVHAKLMIVDDEYIVVGSANINQRSLDGSRDTEIAMGAYQRAYLAGKTAAELPRGQVHGLRMALWNEHTNVMAPWFLDPSSLEATRGMIAIGSSNWARWAADEVMDMESHLCTYPLDITADGRVQHLEGIENIPDTDGKIMGSISTLPAILSC